MIMMEMILMMSILIHLTITQRRRSEQDELMMRDFLCEGDLISVCMHD